MIDFNECVEKGLLRKIPSSRRQAEEQIKKSAVLLEEAKKAIDAGLPNSAVMSAYASMLDAARALLFRDGFREKSHACVARYLESKYAKEIGINLIAMFDEYRDKRHKTMYSGEYYPTMKEAERIVSFAEAFLGKIKSTVLK